MADKLTDAALEASPTLRQLSVLSRVHPLNVDDPVQVDGALAAAVQRLIEALDRNAIQFDERADQHAVWQLLFISYQLLTQIRPASPVRH
jgi:hypothetical protein